MDERQPARPSGSDDPLATAPSLDTRMVPHMPVDVRSISLGVLAVFATIAMLDWAAAVFIPLLLGLMFSYALSPMVDRMHAWHIPRAIGAAILLLTVFGGAGATVYSLEDDAAQLIESLPAAAAQLRQVLRPQKGTPDSAIESVQRAASQLERAAADNNAPTAARGVTRVQIEPDKFNIRDHLWTGTLGLIAFIGQTTVVCFITFFLLVSGDTFRRKMVRIAGPTFAKKKITLQVLDEITGQIKRYLLVQVFTSGVVGVATWLVFVWIGLAHAAVWGILAGVLNLVPYFGAIAVTGGAALVGFVQFGTLEMALLVAGASFCVQCVEGYILTPWLTNRVSRMNPVVIFVGVLAWGWLWGMWGLLLGMPILMAIKAICDRIDDLKPIGELLGD